MGNEETSGVQDATQATQTAAPAPSPSEVIANTAQVPAVQTEPQDISQAFAMLRETEQAVSSETVGTPEAQEGNDGDSGSASTSGGNVDGQLDGTTDQGPTDVGGSTDQSDSVDYSAIRQGMMQDIQRQSMLNAAQFFKEKNIKPMSVGDLYQRNEETGEVSFRNIDDPSHPFSTRMEAQAWIDAYNQSLQGALREQQMKSQRELLQQSKPVFDLLAFMPTLETLDDETVATLDALIKPYEVEQGGKVIGYNCDLNQMLNTANNIVANTRARYATKETTPAQPQEETPAASPVTPALDMKTTGGNSTDSQQVKEPKNISEAMALLGQMSKEKNNV